MINITNDNDIDTEAPVLTSFEIDDNNHRFFSYVNKFGTEQSIKGLQKWISENNFSSHMSVLGIK